MSFEVVIINEVVTSINSVGDADLVICNYAHDPVLIAFAP